MILKLRIYCTEKGVSWRLLDKIKKIDYSYIYEKVMLKKRTKNIAIPYFNTYPLRKINGKESKLNKKIAEVCIVYENGQGDMFYTDDMVFIMNDNGKTCDTINV